MMSNILIEANNISKIYDPDIMFVRGKNFYALNNVDFVINEGDFITVMGPSGSGKSTLLNCISTLDMISKGSLRILGEPASTMNDGDISRFRYEYLGFVFQNHNLISSLSIYDNIAAPIMLGEKSPKEINDKVQMLANQLHIEKILEKKPHECSGGERQRAAIARAMVNDPKIIVCDEPTGNLDSTNSHEVLEILADLNAKQGISIVIVTHDAMIASYAKTFMYLRDGQVHNVLERGEADQVDFYNEIIKVSAKDSLLDIFGDRKVKVEPVLSDTSSDVKVKNTKVDNRSKGTQDRVVAVLGKDAEITKEMEQSRIMYLLENEIEYKAINDRKIIIPYNTITELSMTLKPVMAGVGVFSEYQYYPMLTMKTKDSTYILQLMNSDNLIPIFDKLNTASVKIEDPIDIQGVFKKYTVRLEINRHFQRMNKRLQKEFGVKFQGYGQK